MRQRGFAAARRTSDNVERKFRDASAQNVVETAHTGRQFVDRDFSLPRYFFRQFAFCRSLWAFHFPSPLRKSNSLRGSFGHDSRTNRSVKSAPMKVTRSPRN